MMCDVHMCVDIHFRQRKIKQVKTKNANINVAPSGFDKKNVCCSKTRAKYEKLKKKKEKQY